MEELFSLLSLNIVIHSSNLFVIETMVVSCIPSVKGDRKHLLSRKQTIARLTERNEEQIQHLRN